MERAHKDGISVDSNSPEEFDEYYWKVFLNDSFIGQNALEAHNLSNEVLERFITYIKLICIAKKKHRYLSKNNNNILRLEGLMNIEDSSFFFLARNPLDHASSLLKLHLQFSEEQSSDPFTLEYFNYLGHHEFGLNHKPFHLTNQITHYDTLDKNTLEFWLLVWKDYYSYLLEMANNQIEIILFEDLVGSGNKVFGRVNKLLNLDIRISDEPYRPPTYKSHNSKLLNECVEIYGHLKERRKYT